ncbi:putative integral membrane protein [Aspergillus chevalieri]|uniref:Rhodopsin domain-containing protein n=1 Tax=Aspergillus chevalieri TaxID=182096 RepID=A0A7R7ZJT2_ASPCH|nr:uncharacterized protein ACHE_20151S [Aspergillus chevalieri]BCR84693.1 hypothetical protein ACHE_20151S [Aspergillus chevalieri]
MVEFAGRSESIFIVTIIFLVISLVAVCLRCFVRIRLVRAFGWDDGLMVAAMVVNILFALCGIVGPIYGIGQTFEQLDMVHNLKKVQKAMFWWWLGQMSYVIVVVLAKVSIALALLRLTVARVHAIILWVIIAFSIVIGLVFWFMLTLQCTPVSYFWERTGSGSCIKTDYLIDIAYLYSVVATVCDFTLALLPIVLVWNLQMTTKTKAALAGILSMGCVSSAAVIVRIPYLHYYKDPDFLYATTDISIWSNVEAGLGITAGSLVTLRPLFRWFRGDSYARTYGAKPTTGSIPLSSMNGNLTNRSRNDPNNNHYWRSDLVPDNAQAMAITTHGSKGSSQESLNPTQGQGHGHDPGYQGRGVSVQKSFYVSTEVV